MAADRQAPGDDGGVPAADAAPGAPRDDAGRDGVPSGEVVVPVIVEELEVRTRTVESGGAVRLRKLVHEDTVTVDEPLSTETYEVERVAVGRPVEGAVPVRHEGDTMIVPVLEERLVTRRQLVLVEEIRLTRRTHTYREPRTVTLRREEVVAERLDPASGEWRRIDEPAGGLAAEPEDPSGAR